MVCRLLASNDSPRKSLGTTGPIAVAGSTDTLAGPPPRLSAGGRVFAIAALGASTAPRAGDGVAGASAIAMTAAATAARGLQIARSALATPAFSR